MEMEELLLDRYFVYLYHRECRKISAKEFELLVYRKLECSNELKFPNWFMEKYYPSNKYSLGMCNNFVMYFDYDCLNFRVDANLESNIDEIESCNFVGINNIRKAVETQTITIMIP